MNKKTNENEENKKEIKQDSKEIVDTKKEEMNKAEIKGQEKQKKQKVEKSVAREIMEWIICIVVAFALALIIKYYIFTPTLVMQESMTPTILNGERVLINRLVRTFHWDLNRGDIITFEAPAYHKLEDGGLTAIYHEVDGVVESFLYNVMEIKKTSYIKRVIGLPGDEIEIKNGKVYVNGELQKEEYLQSSVKTYMPEGGMPNKFTVPEGYIFAMGDNREGSSDCRLFGCIPIDKVEGRVTMRIWPLTKLGGIDK